MKPYYKKWLKFMHESNFTTEQSVSSYINFVNKYKGVSDGIKTKIRRDEEGYTEDIYVQVDEGNWEVIGSIDYDRTGNIVRNGNTWFDTTGLEDILEKIKEDSDRNVSEYDVHIEEQILAEEGGAGGGCSAGGGVGSSMGAGAVAGYAGDGLGGLTTHKKKKKTREKQFYDND